MTTAPNLRAFTLIEMMIAVALGMLIVYVAMAGFRMASQSITITNQLALENAILRAGCQAANERLDFWTDYDDPEADASDPRARILRGYDATGGMPFTPMSKVFALTPDGDPERVRGWDPKEPWKASDPRTWWQGNLAEKVGSEMALGRYSIFSNSQPPVLITGAASGIGVYGTVTPAHLWHNRQVWGLQSALGFYGFTEYLPQNTLFACYQEYQVAVMPPFFGTNQDGMPLLLFKPDLWNAQMFYNGEGSGIIPGLWRLTMATSYGVIMPSSANAGNPSSHRTKYITGYADQPGEIQRFNRETLNRRNLLAGPANWPTANVQTQHFIKTGRYVNLCRVQMVSPITGAATELTFTGFATTLRGARLQRRHPDDPGYARSKWVDHDNRTATDDGLTLDDTP